MKEVRREKYGSVTGVLNVENTAPTTVWCVRCET